MSPFICEVNKLRQGRKKKIYLNLVIGNKILRDQKIYCKVDWKSVHS